MTSTGKTGTQRKRSRVMEQQTVKHCNGKLLMSRNVVCTEALALVMDMRKKNFTKYYSQIKRQTEESLEKCGYGDRTP